MCSITYRGCRSLACSETLHEVDISACPGIDGQAIKALVTRELPFNCNHLLNEMEDEKKEIQMMGRIGERDRFSQLTSIAARFATSVDASIFHTLVTNAPHLLHLDLRHYLGKDDNMGHLSPLKLSLRELQKYGVQIAFSRSQNGYIE